MQSLRWVFKLFIIFSLGLEFFQSDLQVGACTEGDRAALLRVKASILKANAGSLSSWVGSECCSEEWEGVQCENERVTGLAIENLMLKGPIPSSLGEFQSLKALSLTGNRFQGQLLPSLGNLTGLVLLNMGSNILTGPVPPTFNNLHLLQLLDRSLTLSPAY